MRALYLFFLFSIPCLVEGQITFLKEIGGSNSESGICVRPVSGGGYIICGNTSSYGAGLQDAYLIRTNAVGDTIWTRTFGTAGNGDYAEAVRQTSDGGFIVLGDGFLLKINASGNFLWQTSFAGLGLTGTSNSIEQTSDGGYIIIGNTYVYGAGSSDIYLLKTDSNGNITWTKTFGGTDFDNGQSVKQTNDGGYILCGYTGSFGNFLGATYLIKTDSYGDTLWTRIVASNSAVKAYDVHQTSDSCYVISGYTGVLINNSSYDFILAKFDANGNLMWDRAYGGMLNEWSYSLTQTSDGGFAFTGFSQSFNVSGNLGHVYIIRTNAFGDTLWTRLVGDPANGQTASHICEVSDRGFILTGWDSGTGELFLLKTDSLGNVGCDAKSTATILTTPILSISRPPTQVSFGSSVGSYPMLVGHGATETTICLLLSQVEEIGLASNILISPNPSSGLFTIHPENNSSGEIYVTNVLGEVVFQATINSSEMQIDLSAEPEGIYFVTVNTGHEIFTQKIVVQK